MAAEVFRAADLARGVPLQRQPRILRLHALRRRPRRGSASCRRARWRSAIRRAPASIAFSTSSLTTDAGRSTTSPAAIWLARSREESWMRATVKSTCSTLNTASITPAITTIIARRPTRTAAVSPPGSMRQRHVHPPHAGENGQRQKNRRDHGQDLHHHVQPIGDGREVRVEDACHPILKESGLFRQPDEMVVDVAKPVGDFVADLLETPGARAGQRRRAAESRPAAARPDRA